MLSTSRIVKIAATSIFGHVRHVRHVCNSPTGLPVSCLPVCSSKLNVLQRTRGFASSADERTKATTNSAGSADNQTAAKGAKGTNAGGGQNMESSKSKSASGSDSSDKKSSSKEDAQRKLQREEHEEFVTVSGGGKPNTARMWKAVPEENASTDTGGYIKLEDIGMDPKEVDKVHQKDNENDARLKAAKDTTGSAGGANGTPTKSKGTKPTEQGEATSTSTGQDKKTTSNSTGQDKKATSNSTGQETKSSRTEKDAARQKDHQDSTEAGQEDSQHRRTVSNAQQSVVWEGTPRATTGGAQSSPDVGGIDHLTEQLLDREAAAKKRNDLEAEKEVVRPDRSQKTQTKSDKGNN